MEADKFDEHFPGRSRRPACSALPRLRLLNCKVMARDLVSLTMHVSCEQSIDAEDSDDGTSYTVALYALVIEDRCGHCRVDLVERVDSDQWFKGTVLLNVARLSSNKTEASHQAYQLMFKVRRYSSRVDTAHASHVLESSLYPVISPYSNDTLYHDAHGLKLRRIGDAATPAPHR